MRIVSLISSATELLYGMGLGEAVVGVSHECDYPAEAATKPRLTRSYVASERPSEEIDAQVKQLTVQGEPLYEVLRDQLVALQPDLIVTQAQCDVCAVRYEDVAALVEHSPALRQTKLVALNPLTLEDVLEDAARLGRVTGRRAAAKALLARLQKRIDRVVELVGELEADQRPRVTCIEWTEPLMLAGNWIPAMIQMAGGRQQVAPGGAHSTYHDWRDVVRFDPEVLIVAACGFDLRRTLMEADSLTSLPGWSQLAAVRSRRVFGVDGNAYFNRSGPRLVDTLEILAHLLHPDRVPSPKLAPDAWCSIKI